MRHLENPMVQTDYTPMIDAYAYTPVHNCDWCGVDIYPGEKYLDIGEIICAECVGEHMKEA